MISIEALSKFFKVPKRSVGLREAAKSLFYREYTTAEALKDISFSIKPGEIVGYIGPNGAGKSTTIKVMSAILVPDSGTCSIRVYSGHIPAHEAIEQIIVQTAWLAILIGLGKIAMDKALRKLVVQGG
ncbi:hypothetical protein CVD25_10150 [Bacillus canaveralius]|uniref:ABC transporter domain-containing protein n=1 Tax=Bacillus canaveralius TaxID=1403243 RepID=A0A2N5GMG8_9BACI|nr:ATP-binding cassette domain-containing protein [Bacillus canaveralius]PLR83003.1 hypothetical protein CU635_11050 [Bacillus canaveralius]PLR96993.1 hypothetical protein CVD25_10150 [Bacillus canaveralius]